MKALLILVAAMGCASPATELTRMGASMEPALFGECTLIFEHGTFRLDVRSTPGIAGLGFLPLFLAEQLKHLLWWEDFSLAESECGEALESMLELLNDIGLPNEENCEIWYDAH